MPGPLDHIIVIEAADVMPAAIAGMLLADHGADVIKVEAIQRMDGMRMAGPVASDAGPIYELSPLYHGVALVRAANAGAFTLATVGHVVVLLGIAAVGIAVAARRLGKLLLS